MRYGFGTDAVVRSDTVTAAAFSTFRTGTAIR